MSKYIDFISFWYFLDDKLINNSIVYIAEDV